MVDLDKVLALIRAMNEEGVEYITFGAIAMGVHALPPRTDMLRRKYHLGND